MGRPKKPTVADAVGFWKAAKLRDGSLGRTTVYFAEKFLDKMGKAKVLELTGADITNYVDRGQGSPAQRREINTVKGIVNFYRQMHGHQPIYAQRPRDGKGRSRWLSVEERERFLAACPPEIAPLVTGLFFTGARRGELEKLRPTSVDYRDRLLRLESRKGGRGLRERVIPIHDRLWEYVKDTEGQKLVFPDPKGKQWDGDAFRDIWWNVVVSLGMTDFLPHDARHTFASELVRQGVGLRQVADLLGHSSLAMVYRYSHVDLEDKRSVVLQL